MTDIRSERYIGDGLYASFDGEMIKLRAPRESGDDVVYLESSVYREFVAYARQIFGDKP